MDNYTDFFGIWRGVFFYMAPGVVFHFFDNHATSGHGARCFFAIVIKGVPRIKCITLLLRMGLK